MHSAAPGGAGNWSQGDYLGTGSGLGTRFLLMLGLIAFRALTGASALAAVPIWVAKDAYCIVNTVTNYNK